MTDEKIYLAVWALGVDTVKVNVKAEPEKIKIAYPIGANAEIKCFDGYFDVKFPTCAQAIFLEIQK